jgi:glucokinase
VQFDAGAGSSRCLNAAQIPVLPCLSEAWRLYSFGAPAKLHASDCEIVKQPQGVLMENVNDRYWLGFDLGATKMMATVFDGEYRPVGSKRRKTKGHKGREAGIERVKETLKEALDDAGIEKQQLGGAGVGSPGPLDLNQGTLPQTANLGWNDVNLKALLEEELLCPAVVLNDVDAGVYGEYRCGSARGARCVVGLFPGTGLGAGCVYEGEILRGTAMSCFELGHCRVLPDGPVCGCGQRGCLETVASRLAISSQAASAAYRGEAPNLLEAKGLDLSNIRSKALAASIEAGDVVVEQIVRDAARWLGVGAGILVNLLAPDRIVLGGGLVEALPELYLDEVRLSARNSSVPGLKDIFDVAVAELGDDSSVTGAAAWARKIITGGAQ